MSNLRIRYAIASSLFLSVSAIPLEQITRREENSSSLEKTIEDAVHLDKDIKADKDQESDEDSDDDSDDEDDAVNNDSRNRPSVSSISATISINPTSTPTSLADSLPTATSATSALPVTSTSSSPSRSNGAAIAGGTISALVIFAVIAFLVFRWRKNKRINNNNNDNNNIWTDEKQAYPYPQPPPSTLFGGGSSQHPATAPAPAPTMPKPPPLVFMNDRSPFRDPDTNEDSHRTFYLESESSNGTRLPPVYEELRSPGMESSISQIEPYPEKAPVRKIYASFVPPPIPQTQDPMVSRFSWTTKRSSTDSEPMFRGVKSWVSHQADRPPMKKRLAELGLEEGAPPTPVAFRFHPGAPVSFTAGHGRIESEDLDRQMKSGR